MPNEDKLAPIEEAWINFIKSVRNLLIVQSDDRPLDQYLEFRNKVLALVEETKFLDALHQNWAPFTDYPEIESGQALLLELQAFPRAVEVAQTAEPSKGLSRGLVNRWLSRASIVAGSVNDIIDDLPPYAKNAITLFKELCKLFNGKE